MRILWQVVGSTLLLILTACSSGSGSQTSVDSKLYDCSEQDQSSIVPIQELYPSIIIQDTLETGVFSFKAKFFADEDAFLNSGEFNFGTGARLGCEDTFSVSVGLDESFLRESRNGAGYSYDRKVLSSGRSDFYIAMQRGDDVLLNTLFDFNDVLTVEPLATAYRNADSTITFTWNTNSDAETIAIHFDGTCTINNGLLGLFSNSKEYYSFSVEIDNDGSESYRGGYFLFSEDGRANNFLQAFFDGDLSFCSVDATFDIVSTENIGAPFAAGKVNLYRQSTISFRVDN